MRNKLLAACLLLVGCAPDFTTKHGTRVYADGSPINQVVFDHAEDWLVGTLQPRGFDPVLIDRALSRAVVELTHTGRLVCRGTEGGCDGMQDMGTLRVRDDMFEQGTIEQCSKTMDILLHEELHWLQLELFNFVDFHHTLSGDLWRVIELNQINDVCRDNR